MNIKLYTSNNYFKKNPTYHIEDSDFKSDNFIEILKKNKFNFQQTNTVVDVGCGAGKIIRNLKERNYFKRNTNFYGFDINKRIINFANLNATDNLKFFNKDFFKSNFKKKPDLIICADVFEHIDDYINFLNNLSAKGKFFLFNIPLDLSLRTLLFNKSIKNNFNKIGHIHFFNKNICKLILNYCNFNILDMMYAKNFIKHEKKNSIKKIIAAIPLKILDYISQDLSANIFGGYSLVCLAKSKSKSKYN